ncbi:unnamed protein product [Schistocephalus solidus]|uniref:EVE domain-containing protein n=1 Tax=Schistocephalus solidus TaxID=70667 RepID=A0A183T205_SCHSO|nr:unnamed protein product [Schistocephalus solidus]
MSPGEFLIHSRDQGRCSGLVIGDMQRYTASSNRPLKMSVKKIEVSAPVSYKRFTLICIFNASFSRSLNLKPDKTTEAK